jgi:hypothetical protein
VANEYERNDFGLLIRSKNKNREFKYSWDENNILQDIHYQDDIGDWQIHTKEINNISIKFNANKSTQNHSISSALGNWCYSENKSLFEMIVPGGERYLKKGNENTGIELWSSNGQTSYQFNEKKVLTGISNSDGSNTVFYPDVTGRTVFLVSAKGIAFLHYDKDGYLSSERDQQTNGFAYQLTKQKALSQMTFNENTIKTDWSMDGKLEKFKLNKTLEFMITHKSGIPDQITFKSSSLGYMDAMETAIRFIWNWEAMMSARRLYNNSQAN